MVSEPRHKLGARDPVPRNQSHKRFGFPKQDGYSMSTWLRDAQGDQLLNHLTTPDLPPQADIVIIGSGLTGTLIAKHCVETWPTKKIVILEAREFCSGATGRNAGHCKPDQWRGYSGYEAEFGTSQALKILENEQQTWSNLVAYVQEHNVDCDLWVGDTLDVPITPDAAKTAKTKFDRFKATGAKVDHIKVIQSPAEAAKVSGIKEAQACYAWSASTLHPWKLAAHIMRNALSQGANLQTNTQVMRVTQAPRSSKKWVVGTLRGNIECSQVIYATNAYSSALIPSLRGIISPSPHVCNQVTPPSTFQQDRPLKNSYGVLASDGNMFSINPRIPSGGKSVLFGGSNSGQTELADHIRRDPKRCVDDSLTDFAPITTAVDEFAESQLWSTEVGSKQEEVDNHSWSGIVALSADTMPFIGELPGQPGQWICAGYHAHGMARIFTAAPAVVKLMAGSTWEDTKLPEVCRITPERLQRLKDRGTEIVVSRL